MDTKERREAAAMLKPQVVERFEAAIGEMYEAAIDLGVVRAIEHEHTEDNAGTETILDAIEALLSAIYSATGLRHAVARIEQYADGWDYAGPCRIIEDGGTVGGVTIASEGMWQAFVGHDPFFVRSEDAPRLELVNVSQPSEPIA